MADRLSVEIVTGERVVYSEEGVEMVVAPGADGALGILPHHAPLVTLLSAGELRVTKGGQERALAVFGGFMEVTGDRVIILADSAEHAEEIDLARAEEARARAAAATASGVADGDLQSAAASLRRATIRLRIGQRRGGRRGPGVGPGNNEV